MKHLYQCSESNNTNLLLCLLSVVHGMSVFLHTPHTAWPATWRHVPGDVIAAYLYHNVTKLMINIHDTTLVVSTLVAAWEGCLVGSDLPSIDSMSVSALIFRPPRLPYSCSRRCCSAKWRCFAASALCFCISTSSDGDTGLPALTV